MQAPSAAQQMLPASHFRFREHLGLHLLLESSALLTWSAHAHRQALLHSKPDIYDSYACPAQAIKQAKARRRLRRWVSGK